MAKKRKMVNQKFIQTEMVMEKQNLQKEIKAYLVTTQFLLQK